MTTMTISGRNFSTALTPLLKQVPHIDLIKCGVRLMGPLADRILLLTNLKELLWRVSMDALESRPLLWTHLAGTLTLLNLQSGEDDDDDRVKWHLDAITLLSGLEFLRLRGFEFANTSSSSSAAAAASSAGEEDDDVD